MIFYSIREAARALNLPSHKTIVNYLKRCQKKSYKNRYIFTKIVTGMIKNSDIIKKPRVISIVEHKKPKNKIQNFKPRSTSLIRYVDTEEINQQREKQINLINYLIKLKKADKIRDEKISQDTGYTYMLDSLNYHENYFEEKNISKFLNGQAKIYNKLKDVKQTLEEINVKVGFVSSTDIFNNKHYPIISDLARKLLKRNVKTSDINDLDLAKYYNWIRNILMLNYYTLTNKSLNSINKNLNEYRDPYNSSNKTNQELLNLKAGIILLSSWSEKLLDASIRQHLKRNRPKIITDIYNGYDTEYLPIDWGKNELLSAQLATTAGIKIEVPLPRSYKYEGVNTLTSETYLKDANSIPKSLDNEIISRYIQQSINYNRNILYQKHDDLMIALCNYLINDKSDIIDQYNRTDKGVIFQFKKLPVNKKFLIPQEGEKLEISWNTLIKMINDSKYEELQDYINIIFKGFSFKDKIY